MYFKYLGLDKETRKVRMSFLNDGLFRFTQPQELNDPREAKPKFFIHEYSSKDLALGRSELMRRGFGSNEISDEEVMVFALNPFPPRRYGDENPHLVRQEGYNSMKEYDEAQLLNAYKTFNTQLNNEVGVFSLTCDNKNEVMWTSYGNEYNGVVVEFTEELEFLPDFISDQVKYDLNKISFQLSLNKGVIRFNGIDIDNMSNRRLELTDQLLKSFLFHKEEKWEYEDEFRMISRLSDSEKVYGDIHLEKIPFSIFKAIYIGHKVNKEEIDEIIAIIKNNQALSHIKAYFQKNNEFTGEIEFLENK